MSAVFRILPIVAYGIAWALSSRTPAGGVGFLIIAGSLISAPQILTNIVVQVLLSVIVGALVVAIPCAAPLIVVLMLWRMWNRLHMVFQNIGLMGAEMAIYCAILLFPFSLRSAILPQAFDANHPAFGTIVMFLVGASVMYGCIYLMREQGVSRSRINLFVLGLPAVLIMLIVGGLIDGHGSHLDGSDT